MVFDNLVVQKKIFQEKERKRKEKARWGGVRQGQRKAKQVFILPRAQDKAEKAGWWWWWWWGRLVCCPLFCFVLNKSLRFFTLHIIITSSRDSSKF